MAASQISPGSGIVWPPAKGPASMRYVARQPILDLRSRVHGYELLFRAGPEAAFSGDGELATRIMLDNTVMFGLETLTGGLPAFVNCTGEALASDLLHVLPPSMTVLEILETVEPTPEMIASCRKLKAAGFRLALDDFTWKPRCEPLIELADYIKVDFLLTGAEERKKLLGHLKDANLVLLAEKVETQAEFEHARDEGFTLFQGYYFCRPLLIENRNVPPNRLSQLEILRLLHSGSLQMKELTRLVKRDASLTYRVLRLVNSPMSAMRREVNSIHSALLAVGEDVFRRIATLAVTSELSGDEPEVLRMAFVRGRFCEEAAALCNLNETEQYLLGLLSLLPAMLRIPMAAFTPSLPMRTEIRDSLEGASVRERALLAWIEFHEHGDWSACTRTALAMNVDEEELLKLYARAVMWAEDSLRGLL